MSLPFAQESHRGLSYPYGRKPAITPGEPVEVVDPGT